jgi:hypothetical protein
MKLIFVRSPIVISVNESGQTGAKVKLYIWNKGDTIPTLPTYTLSKDIPTTTQTELNFNLSNYIREFIDNIIPISNRTTSDIETNEMWCNITVEKYKTVSGIDTLLTTDYYIASNGYGKYEDGLNGSPINSNIISLNDSTKKIYYYRDSGNYPYVNVFFDNSSTTKSIEFRWTPKTGTVINETHSDTGIFNYTVPVALTSSDFNNESTLTILDNITGLKIDTFTIIPVCEPKYTPVECSYINRRGGWQFLTFFKAQTNTINTKGSTYRMMPSALYYKPAQAQTKSFNINGQQSVKLNTGWVDENYSDLITDLLLSETILLDGKPVELKTTSSDLKTSLKDKMINYEIEFDYAFNLINDVV